MYKGNRATTVVESTFKEIRISIIGEDWDLEVINI